MLQARSKILLICSHWSRYLSIRVVIFVSLYLLVSFLINVYLLHWNVSFMRGDKTLVLLTILYHVPSTVSGLTAAQ